MSEYSNATDPNEAVTHASILSLAADLPADAVAAENARAAPADAISHGLQLVNERLHRLETHLGTALPLVNTAAAVASAAFPEVAPVLSRLAAIEGFLVDFLAAFHAHFGGKLDLPPAPRA